MNARQAWRLAATISAVCWCGFAAAQEPGRPRMEGVLIDDLPGKHDLRRMDAEKRRAEAVVEELQMLLELQQAQPKTEFEQFRDGVERELQFIGRACSLTLEERQRLDHAHTMMINKFKSLLAKQAGNGKTQEGGVPRMVAVEGRIVVRDVRARTGVDFLDQLARAQIDVAIHDVLSNERLVELAAERERLVERTRAADALALLAEIDEAMLLAADQVERLRAYLDAQWRPEWGKVSRRRLPASGATPLQSAVLRGLAVVFAPSEAVLETYLRPAQFEAWRGVRTLMRNEFVSQNVPAIRQRINQLQNGFPGARFAEPAFRVLRDANGAMVLQGEMAVTPLPRIRNQLVVGERQPVTGDDPCAFDDLTIVDPPRELATLLGLLVEDATLASQLSGAQRETLLLAGKLDLRHYCVERQERLQEMLQRGDKTLGARRIVVQAELVATGNPFAAADSRFRKALASRLDEEQLARLAAADRKRRELRREAAVQSLVRQLDEAAKLTSAQWDALADAIRRRQEQSAAAVADDFQSESDACVTWLAKADLQPLLDADQWPASEQKLIELKRVAGAASPPGAP